MAARNTFLLVPLIIDVLTGLLLTLVKSKILYQVAFKGLLFINVIANTSLLSINSVKQSLAQTLEARDKPLPAVSLAGEPYVGSAGGGWIAVALSEP